MYPTSGISRTTSRKRHCDSLQEKGYTIRKEIVYDIKALHSDYLIRNIDLAFQAWQKPWAKDISFEGFCRYILPYRAEVEPASDMRQELMEYYLPLIDSGKARNAFEACMIINKQFINDLKYKETGQPFYRLWKRLFGPVSENATLYAISRQWPCALSAYR